METHWIRAVLVSIVMAFIFGDPIVAHNLNLAPWGGASIFFAAFFVQIFIDKRTRLRRIMAIIAMLSLCVFYVVYAFVPDKI